MIHTNQAELKITAGLSSQFPNDNLPQIVFSGRSNVGKSSLINMLLSRKSLARVSGAPGKTITINFYDVDHSLYLVDLPGYGFAKRPPEDKAKWSKLTDNFFTTNDRFGNVKLVVQLVDSRLGFTDDDASMIQYLSSRKIPFCIVATKADKLNATERKISEEAISTHRLAQKSKEVIYASSKDKMGKDQLWKLIFSLI